MKYDILYDILCGAETSSESWVLSCACVSTQVNYNG